MVASKRTSSDLVEILMKNEADVNLRNQEGNTALHYLTRFENESEPS